MTSPPLPDTGTFTDADLQKAGTATGSSASLADVGTGAEAIAPIGTHGFGGLADDALAFGDFSLRNVGSPGFQFGTPPTDALTFGDTQPPVVGATVSTFWGDSGVPTDYLTGSDSLTIIKVFSLADTLAGGDALGFQYTGGFSSSGHTAVSFGAVLRGPFLGTGMLSNGRTDVSFTAAVDGVINTGFTAAGSTAVSLAPTGDLISAGFVASGVGAAAFTLTGQLMLSTFSCAGATRVLFIDTPDLSDNEPMWLAMALSGSISAGAEEGA